MIFLHLLFRQIYVVEMILAFVCISVSIQIRRHLHFICYRVLPPGCLEWRSWCSLELPSSLWQETWRDDQLSQPGWNVDVLQQMPRSPGILSSEILVHDVHPEISAPGPQCRHFQCLHIMHEQRRVELQQCSCVHCTAVPKFAVQPTCGIQAAMSDPQHEEYFPQSSSSSQARLLEAASSSHLQASPHLPHSSWKKQAQKNLQSSRWSLIKGAACRGFPFTLPRG